MENKGNEYTGPTSQAPTVLNPEKKTDGISAGCASCKKAHDMSQYPSTASTRYITNDGVEHYHVYIANFGIEDGN